MMPIICIIGLMAACLMIGMIIGIEWCRKQNKKDNIDARFQAIDQCVEEVYIQIEDFDPLMSECERANLETVARRMKSLKGLK